MTYHNEPRTHLSLDKDAPILREVQSVGRISQNLISVDCTTNPQDLICDKDSSGDEARKLGVHGRTAAALATRKGAATKRGVVSTTVRLSPIHARLVHHPQPLRARLDLCRHSPLLVRWNIGQQEISLACNEAAVDRIVVLAWNTCALRGR
jgi:hypothetical protein